jgi:hypothetical protein
MSVLGRGKTGLHTSIYRVPIPEHLLNVSIAPYSFDLL